MAKISLREYNREIQELISHGHNDEAIAHCKYILKLFPKHIDTYRLLGQAYLESQRYSEATDILRRTLSVIPEDFISQVGMSVIREDEGNLDAAIWHMERAFEVQPSNATIQDELRRLYGRRDGVEPPKMRLTRGALVRMYARGELYPQAIAEIRSALTEDAPRPDLEVLLARMHYLLGQVSDSVKISKRILEKLPYCYEPIRILAELLPETREAELAKSSKDKLNALDPYSIFIAENAPTSEQIPDNAVTLERLNYSPIKNSDQQPEWATTIGATIEGESEPDAINWLPEGTPEIDFQAPDPNKDERPLFNMAIVDDEENDGLFPEIEFEDENGAPPTIQSLMGLSGLEENASEAAMTIPENDDETIPDWMKEAGWDEGNSESSGGQEPPSPYEEPDQPAEETELPDWLQAVKPDTGEISLPNAEESKDSPVEGTDSISEGLDDASSISGLDFPGDEEIPDWLSSTDLTEQSDISIPVIPDAEPDDTSIPDWLTETPSIQAEETTETTPESRGLAADSGQSEGSDDNETASSTMQAVEDAPEEEIPDWLESPPSAGDTYIGTELSDFLKAQQPITDSGADDHIDAEQTDPESELNVVDLDPADMGDDESFAWLESLAAKRGADPETLFTTPEERQEEMPESVQGEISDIESFLSETTASQEVGDVPDSESMIAPTIEQIEDDEEEIPDPIEMNEDDSFAWLESLAANRGVDPQTLLTSPDERPPTQPDLAAAEPQSSELDQESVNLEEPSETNQPPENIEEYAATSPEDDNSANNLAELTPEESAEQMQEIPDWIANSETFPDDTPQELEPTLPAWIQGTDFLEEEAEPALHQDDSSAPIEIAEPELIGGEIELLEASAEAYPIQPSNLEAPPADDPLQEIQVISDSDNGASDDYEEVTTPADEIESQDPLSSQLPEKPQTSVEHSGETKLDYESAQELLAAGQVGAALTGYNELIKSRANLDGIIDDLEQALDTHPVDPEIWGTLGYAYQYSDRIRDALDAYTKAEELLR
jgi:tetratricopeptide (TPR) repeat protein